MLIVRVVISGIVGEDWGYERDKEDKKKNKVFVVVDTSACKFVKPPVVKVCDILHVHSDLYYYPRYLGRVDFRAENR